MARRYFYFVRHGEYEVDSATGEAHDGHLTALGREHAIRAAQELSSQPICVIHHSTAIRAVETAALLIARQPSAEVRPSDLLRECIPSVPDAYREYFVDVPADVISKGATQAAQAVVAYLRRPPPDTDQYEVIVAHGNILGHLVSQILRAPLDSWMSTHFDCGGISRAVIDSQGRMRLLSHNETGHLHHT
jgi:probable phosphoglycerate mutase